MNDEHAARLMCFDRFCRAVREYQRNNRQAVDAYLRGIEARCGRDVAERTEQSIIACARHEKWGGAVKS